MEISSKVICIVIIILVMHSFENYSIEIVWMQSLQNVYIYMMYR